MPFLWAKLSSKYKNSTSLSEFKTKIKIGKVVLSLQAMQGLHAKYGYVLHDRSIESLVFLQKFYTYKY